LFNSCHSRFRVTLDEVIVGTGIDLAEVDRIRASIERHGDRFVQRIYTPGEIAYVERKANRYERYAARFAAKEAGMKAIGTGWRQGVTWHDFEVANLPSGRPTLKLSGRAAEFAERLGVKRISLSLTHTAASGMAFVILED
jgi:holo-[acyl-carrier protein] synthase